MLPVKRMHGARRGTELDSVNDYKHVFAPKFFLFVQTTKAKPTSEEYLVQCAIM
jgi:hypothetical protein